MIRRTRRSYAGCTTGPALRPPPTAGHARRRRSAGRPERLHLFLAIRVVRLACVRGYKATPTISIDPADKEPEAPSRAARPRNGTPPAAPRAAPTPAGAPGGTHP